MKSKDDLDKPSKHSTGNGTDQKREKEGSRQQKGAAGDLRTNNDSGSKDRESGLKGSQREGDGRKEHSERKSDFSHRRRNSFKGIRPRQNQQQPQQQEPQPQSQQQDLPQEQKQRQPSEQNHNQQQGTWSSITQPNHSNEQRYHRQQPRQDTAPPQQRRHYPKENGSVSTSSSRVSAVSR